MPRLIVTGANGVGKSHLAARLAARLPDHSCIGFDTLKLTSGWQRRPCDHIDADLRTLVEHDRWILEGGPSLLPVALSRATEVIWLDPPTPVRAWRLLVRPWRNRGRTRPELPPGNVDRVRQQYRFAWSSLRNTAAFRQTIRRALKDQQTVQVIRIRSSHDLHVYLNTVGTASTEPSPRGPV